MGSLRQEVRYLRSLFLYLRLIKQQFTYAREALIYTWKLGLPAFVHTQGDGYYRARLMPPFLNYCYLPLALPPAKYDVFGDTKLCALGMEANLTNTTVPYPWGHLLAVEAAVDKSTVLIALMLTAIVAALASVPSDRRASVV